jgi:hypothetical protein
VLEGGGERRGVEGGCEMSRKSLEAGPVPKEASDFSAKGRYLRHVEKRLWSGRVGAGPIGGA